MRADPKSTKKSDSMTVFFVLLGSEQLKAFRKMLVTSITYVPLFVLLPLFIYVSVYTGGPRYSRFSFYSINLVFADFSFDYLQFLIDFYSNA